MSCEPDDHPKCVKLRRQRYRKFLCLKLVFVAFAGLLIGAFVTDVFGLRKLNLQPLNNSIVPNKKVNFGDKHGKPQEVHLNEDDKLVKPAKPVKTPSGKPTGTSSAVEGDSGSTPSGKPTETLSAADGDSGSTPSGKLAETSSAVESGSDSAPSGKPTAILPVTRGASGSTLSEKPTETSSAAGGASGSNAKPSEATTLPVEKATQKVEPVLTTVTTEKTTTVEATTEEEYNFGEKDTPITIVGDQEIYTKRNLF